MIIFILKFFVSGNPLGSDDYVIKGIPNEDIEKFSCQADDLKKEILKLENESQKIEQIFNNDVNKLIDIFNSEEKTANNICEQVICFLCNFPPPLPQKRNNFMV